MRIKNIVKMSVMTMKKMLTNSYKYYVIMYKYVMSLINNINS